MTLSTKRDVLFIAVAAAFGVPAALLRLLDLAGVIELHLSPGLTVLIFSSAIIGSAFLLSWAAEVAQKDVTQGLVLALVALVAVLPEYAVDFYLTWQAGQDPAGDYVHYATANMTGANRLLVGLGWPLVILVAWYQRRKPLQLDRALSLELLFLLAATLYAFTIPLKGSIALWDGAVLIGLFGLYLWRSGKGESEEPDLAGPAAFIGSFDPRMRRIAVVLLFVYAATIILASAEPFTEGLLDVGAVVGVDEFILVQWVAPLASESPEILIAMIFAFKNQATAAMAMLVSSKVNQWTLLVGSLPVVYTVSLGQATAEGLPLDGRQSEEIWLTAAQSLFAIILLLRWRIGARGALALLIPWATQLGFTSTGARQIYAIGYIVAAFGLLLIDPLRRRAAWGLVPQALGKGQGDAGPD